MEGYKDPRLSPAERAADLLGRMTLREKVGQLTQRLYGFACYERRGEEILLTEEFRQEAERYGGMGALYGLYRALGRPAVSLVLTVISLGTRVALSYALAPLPEIGVAGIWWSIPIGWALADLTGFLLYLKNKERLIPSVGQGVAEDAGPH